MLNKLLAIFSFISCSIASASPGIIVTGDILVNTAANTVLATSGDLSSRGTISASYKVSLVLTGTVAMVFKAEVLNSSDVVQNTLYIAVPANDTRTVNLGAEFNIPNGWEIRVRNATAVILGGQLHATIIYQPMEIN